MTVTIQEKILRGTAKPLRDNVSSIAHLMPTVDAKYPLADEVPKPPNWLPNIHAKKEWQRLAPILHKNGLLTEAS